MAKQKPIQWRGHLIDPDAILHADGRIWAKKVRMLTRCLMAYLDELGPGHQNGIIQGPANDMQEDVQRIVEVLFPKYYAEIDAITDRHEALMRERRLPSKTPIPRQLRKAVFERDGFRCLRCGSQWELCADHIHPESKGGPTTLENLQTLCQKCNGRKSAKVESTGESLAGA